MYLPYYQIKSNPLTTQAIINRFYNFNSIVAPASFPKMSTARPAMVHYSFLSTFSFAMIGTILVSFPFPLNASLWLLKVKSSPASRGFACLIIKEHWIINDNWFFPHIQLLHQLNLSIKDKLLDFFIVLTQKFSQFPQGNKWASIRLDG